MLAVENKIVFLFLSIVYLRNIQTLQQKSMKAMTNENPLIWDP